MPRRSRFSSSATPSAAASFSGTATSAKVTVTRTACQNGGSAVNIRT